MKAAKTVLSGLGAAAVGAAVAVVTMLALHRPGTDGGQGIRAYILGHPEIISEAMERLQDKQTASLIDTRRAAIETPFAGAIAGNPKGDVTLVEYFDYACGYCRASLQDVDRLVANDPELRVIFKELPILSPDSDHAARMSLVAAGAGKFGDYHHALYAGGALDAAKVDQTAYKLGLDPSAAQQSRIGQEIETNLDTARALRMSGTPTFIVGNQILAGAVGYQSLKDAVGKARAARS